jgi:nucleoid-associated protein YgaU
MNSPYGGPGNSVPPAGAPPKADSPPITVPAVGGASPYAVVTPQVDSYDEETYVCKPNDTFLSISRQYYQSEKYERALLLFNRNHPRATDAIRQDPPVMRDGQPVYIPPLRVLERQYASVIPDHIPLPPPVPPLASAAPGYPAPLASSSDRLYRVRPNGEMLWDIAQRTTGRGERWAEIYALNPQLNPQQPIPGGYTLRLPADASVPPSDRP